VKIGEFHGRGCWYKLKHLGEMAEMAEMSENVRKCQILAGFQGENVP
jgi:hypothetical protein